MKQPGEQLQLFDTSNIGPKRPGQKGLDEWIATENPVYHGSFRSDFGDAPAAHFGTIGQAGFRLDAARHSIEGSELSRARYYDPSVTEDSVYDDPDFGEQEPQTHIGRVFARRMDEKPMAGRLIDADANASEAGFLMNEGYEDWEVPHSVAESAGTLMPEWKSNSGGWSGSGYDQPDVEFYSQRSRAGARALGQGRPIAYRNFIEGDNPVDSGMGTSRSASTTSYVVPRTAQQSWEGDLINDPGTQPWVQDWARQRISSGQEGAVPFPSQTIPRSKHDQQTFYDMYDPGAPEPNPPPFPRDLANRAKMADARNTQRPILNQVEFRA